MRGRRRRKRRRRGTLRFFLRLLGLRLVDGAICPPPLLLLLAVAVAEAVTLTCWD